MKVQIIAENGKKIDAVIDDKQAVEVGLIKKVSGLAVNNFVGLTFNLAGFSDAETRSDFERAAYLWLDLWRFSLENGGMDIKHGESGKFIAYDGERIHIAGGDIRYFSDIMFSTKEVAEQAIEKFKPELEWYFNTFLRRWE